MSLFGTDSAADALSILLVRAVFDAQADDMLPTVLALLVDAGLTIAATLAVRWRLGPILAVVVGALTVPLLIAALAIWEVSQPNPRNEDGHWLLSGALVFMEPIAILIGLAASFLTLILRSRVATITSRQSPRRC